MLLTTDSCHVRENVTYQYLMQKVKCFIMTNIRFNLVLELELLTYVMYFFLICSGPHSDHYSNCVDQKSFFFYFLPKISTQTEVLGLVLFFLD